MDQAPPTPSRASSADPLDLSHPSFDPLGGYDIPHPTADPHILKGSPADVEMEQLIDLELLQKQQQPSLPLPSPPAADAADDDEDEDAEGESDDEETTSAEEPVSILGWRDPKEPERGYWVKTTGGNVVCLQKKNLPYKIIRAFEIGLQSGTNSPHGAPSSSASSKTGGGGRSVSHMDSEDSSTDERSRPVAKPSRQSSRATRATGTMKEDDDDDDEEDNEVESETTDTAARGPVQRITLKLGRLPANGGDDDAASTATGSDTAPAHPRFKTGQTSKLVEAVPTTEGAPPEPPVLAIYAHRSFCEKCHKRPADELAENMERKSREKKKSNKKKKRDEDEMSEGEEIEAMGGWLECQHCCVASHFGCLNADQKKGVLKDLSSMKGEKVRTLEIDQSVDFICARCNADPKCAVCHEGVLPVINQVLEPVLLPRAPELTVAAAIGSSTTTDLAQPPVPGVSQQPAPATATGTSIDVEMADAEAKPESGAAVAVVKSEVDEEEDIRELMFRCLRCTRAFHYEHMHKPAGWQGEDPYPLDLAENYQAEGWQCHDCVRWTDTVDKVIAWRPMPVDAVEKRPWKPDYKADLPREYLVKWSSKGFRHVEWIPHQWILANARQKLQNFLTKGSDLDFGMEARDDGATGSVEADAGKHEQRRATALAKVQAEAAIFSHGTPVASPEAESRLPQAWKTPDRILDAYLWRDALSNPAFQPPEGQPGFKPSSQDMMSMNEWMEQSAGVQPKVDDIAWCYIKWGDLPYSAATWDTPPSPSDKLEHEGLAKAFKRYLKGRSVEIPVLRRDEEARRDSRSATDFRNFEKQPDCIVGGTLMPFQLEGLNWLMFQWWQLNSCILADDMGLGKTIQIAAFIGSLAQIHHIYPTLIVVPNSTVSNWIREFEKWCPHVCVVPFFGDKDSKAVIEKYELFTDQRKLKAHCVISTYDIITGASFSALQAVPRWEVLVVDEGQRLKSDSNKIFERLASLKTRHKVLLTGTPLNNNIRELFNLMSFLDPKVWTNLSELEQEFANLDKEKVLELHKKLQPYFLRRVKGDVLQLPPKHEIIVPISMRSLQKEVYKGLMLHNLSMLQGLGLAGGNKNKALKMTGIKKSNLNNLMMQLRKTCQHPYLISPDLEDRTVDLATAHQAMTDGSAKLALLKLMLPRLKERGHRVLLFSQFKIGLDIIQDWLDGEDLSYIRLDGDTPQAQRQKDMDRYNAPGSDIFMYLLSTRAGGVGINLASADTVIVFDPDFNPHQDLQAIARSYRFGQTKKVLVFKFMIKDSVEEKIFEKGKAKMVLDHLIVQNMAKDDDTDVQSMITFGAKALFEEENADEIHYSAQDVEDLITRVETTEDVTAEEGEKDGMSFAFAKIWEANNTVDADGAPKEDPENEDSDFWKKVVEKAEAEKKAQEDALGKGASRTAKRRAAQGNYREEPDATPSKKNQPTSRSPSPFAGLEGLTESEEDDSDFEASPVRDQLGLPSIPGALKGASGKGKGRASLGNGHHVNEPRPLDSEQAALAKTAFKNLVHMAHSLKMAPVLINMLDAALSKSTPPAVRLDKFDEFSPLMAACLELFDLPTVYLQHRDLLRNYLRQLPYVLSTDGASSTHSSSPRPSEQPSAVATAQQPASATVSSSRRPSSPPHSSTSSPAIGPAGGDPSDSPPAKRARMSRPMSMEGDQL